MQGAIAHYFNHPNMIEWQPSGKDWRKILAKILELRDRGLLTIWLEDRDGKPVYVINFVE